MGGARGHRLDLRRVGSVTVVTLQGEISEQFHGLEVGRRLRGEVVLDLAGVERITSFGVREWLTMLRELYATRLTLARCSEPFVHQLSMIRSFAGTGRIASFFAPYLCSSCGTSFSALYDAVADRQAIRSQLPVPLDCPRCSAPALFDEDPSLYLALQHHLVEELEPPMAAAVAQLAELDGVPIRKAVVGNETWITLNTRIDAALRLQRALAGLEGSVVFDLSAIRGTTVEGLERFHHRLRSLGPDVTQVTLVGCPYPLLVRVLEARGGRFGDQRISVASVRVAAHCAESNSRRQVLVDLRVPSNVAALRLGESPQVPNDWCGTALDLGEAVPVLQEVLSLTAPLAPPPPLAPALVQGRTVIPHRGLVAAAPGAAVPIEAFASVSSLGLWPRTTASRAPNTLVPAQTPMAAAAAVAREPVSLPLPVLVVGIAALVAGVFVGTAGLLGGMLLVALEGGSMGLGSADQPWAGAPAWAEQPFARSLTGVDLVGMAWAPTVDEGLLRAREDMTSTLLGHLGRSVMRRGGFELQLPGPGGLSEESLEQAIGAFQNQAGLFASPHRVDGAVQRSPFGVRVAARYAMSDDAWSAASDHYADTEDFRGITVARTFPTLVPSLGGDAPLVIVATRPWMRTAHPGDVVQAVEGRPVTDLDSFRAALDIAWGETAPGAWMQIRVRRGDQPRQIEFRKPHR